MISWRLDNPTQVRVNCFSKWFKIGPSLSLLCNVTESDVMFRRCTWPLWPLWPSVTEMNWKVDLICCYHLSRSLPMRGWLIGKLNQWRIQGRGPGGPAPPLIFRPNIFLATVPLLSLRVPPYLKCGVPSYLKVWVRHWKSGKLPV